MSGPSEPGGLSEPGGPTPETAGDNSEALAQLAMAMRLIAQGRFDTRLKAWPDEPFASIFEDFNHMAESLLGVEALRESFVSNVSHEFKTPLAYIQGYAAMLQDDELVPQLRNRYIGHITKATRKLSDMIGNLLEISNLSRPNARLEMEPFSLDEQLRHAMALFMPAIERKGLSYEVDLARVDVVGNEELLDGVWANLISNAIKYTQAGGTISASLYALDDKAIATISDTGCGMTPNQVRHAFDRFYQGETSHASEGTGLGLAIVNAVVKKHLGTVKVESDLGRGSSFTVELPLAQPD